MSKPYATVDDYAARYGEPSDPDRLAQCLADASRLIDAVLEQHGKEPHEVDRSKLVQVCRSVAHRAMGEGTTAPAGVSQYTMSATPYSETFTFANPNSDAYLTKNEKALLGIGRARLASVPLGWS